MVITNIRIKWSTLFIIFGNQTDAMRLLYTLGIRLYVAAIHVASLFDDKARLWVSGRKGWEKKIVTGKREERLRVWIHCSSLGEFEQGRPVIEELRRTIPDIWITLSFFSPSGYELRKNYDLADEVLYLPSDTPSNVRLFLNLINPHIAVFVKYEFWLNFIEEIDKRKIGIFLISAIFRPEQHFFRWYGKIFLRRLKLYTRIFVQNESSLMLLKRHGIYNVNVAGDTRFDRVAEIAGQARVVEEIERFKKGEKLFIVGSSWPQDEQIIARYINENPRAGRWIFAPHEINEVHLASLERKLKVPNCRLSQSSNISKDTRVIIIDSIGLLSSAYRYCDVAIIGGGFGKGIHNVLEAAVWGRPVLFGPNHTKFSEATALIACGGGFSFASYGDFSSLTDRFVSDESFTSNAGKAAATFVRNGAGATGIVVSKLKAHLDCIKQ